MKLMWDLVDAVALVRRVRPIAEKHGFCIGLTGSNLFAGGSLKDVDLVFYPMNAVQPKYEFLVEALRFELGFKSVVAVNHEPDCKLVISCKSEDGKRYDLFFPGYTFAGRLDTYPTAGKMEGSGAVEVPFHE
jgi:hypothetical protein